MFLCACLLMMSHSVGTTAGGQEIDAFEVQDARVGVLREMGLLFFLSTSPPVGMNEIDFDLLLCSGSGVNVMCKVPGGTKCIEEFVKEFCVRVSARS